MRRSRKMTESNLYLKFRKLGFRLNLVFSNCQLLGDMLVGLDFKRRKLVIADGVGNVKWWHTIELADLRTISVSKAYKSIRAGELSFKKVADFIHSIQVRLDFLDGRESIILPVYGNNVAQRKNIHKIERRLTRWYNMLSGMILKRSNFRYNATHDSNDHVDFWAQGIIA